MDNGPVTRASVGESVLARDHRRVCPSAGYGVHLIIDFWGASRLEDETYIARALESAARAAGAHLLRTEMHAFGEGLGVTGVVLLAESHISIHSWPEDGYAALDIFTCGAADPTRAVPVLLDAFTPERYEVSTHHRGATGR